MSIFEMLCWSVLLPGVLMVAAMLIAAPLYVHMLQLESYQLPGYRRWMKRNAKKAKEPVQYLALAAMLGFAGGLALPIYFSHTLVPLLLVLVAFLLRLKAKRQPAKKPLKYTGRVKRLMGIFAALQALVCAVYSVVFLALPGVTFPMTFRLVFITLQAALLPQWVALAALCASPIEKHINNGFLNEAKAVLASRPDVIRIGITGSFGKTSTKFFLTTILKEKYNVLCTPESINTPMGVTRVIREQLKPEHEVFVSEMGARHVGDIAEMCDLVQPQYGLLTSVGAAHLETFGSMERIASTKYELIQALPQDGYAAIALSGEWCPKLFDRCPIAKVSAGLDDSAQVWAKDLRADEKGTSFTLVTPAGEKEMTTPLLGAHNIQNITLCAAMALKLGLTLTQIAEGVSKLESVPHRLQLMPANGFNTVIDDSFNANPAGAKAAMDVLASFPGRHVVITPGMVELGKEEEERNTEFGRQIAEAAHVAILVGKKRAEPLKKGLEEKNFPAENIHVVENLDEAMQVYTTIRAQGDVLLFENDLPDNYAE